MPTPVLFRIAVVTLALPLAAGALHAQRYERTIDTTFTVRGTPRLNVYNFSGSVRVSQAGGNRVRVQAELEDRRTDVEISERAGRIAVRTSGRRSHDDVDYVITVPEGTAVEIGGISTDVEVRGVCGPLSLNTISGDVTVTCTSGFTSIQSTSGDVSVRDVRGDLEVSATSGDVDVSDVRGNVTINAVSGDVTLAGIGGGDVSAESVSGEITYTGPIRDNGRYRFRSHSGEVVVRVEGGLNATFDVSTFSGTFESDYQVQIEPGTQVSRNWRFRVGSGSARVELGSFSGSVILRRGARSPREE